MTLPDVRRRCQKQNLAFARYSMTYFTFCSLWLVSVAFHIAMVPLATNRGTPTVPDNGGASYPLESLLGHFNQDFPGIFPPWHRPLSLLQCSEPLQGLWLFEQVRAYFTTTAFPANPMTTYLPPYITNYFGDGLSRLQARRHSASGYLANTD